MADQFELRSRESQEIMGTPPGWIMRWGITSLMGLVVIVMIGAYFIKYPDTIIGKVTITTTDPPARLVAQSSGKLVSLFVKNNDTVRQGDYLAVLENVADPTELQQVGSMLAELHNRLKHTNGVEVPVAVGSNLRLNLSHLQVGEIQGALNDFVAATDEYNFFISNDFYSKKIAALQYQSSTFSSLNSQLSAQQNVLNQKLELDKSRLKTNEALAKEKIISTQEVEATRKSYLDQLYNYQSTNATMVQNDLQAQEYQKSILDLEQQREAKRNDLLLKLQTSFEQLNSQFRMYEQKYVIKSPIRGKVSFFKFWNVNQFVQAGEPVMTIIPASEDIIGKAFVPASGSGKLALNQKVKIKLDNFPYREFGIVNGTVKSISGIPQENLYSVDITLTNGLNTSYKKVIPLSNEMTGTAEIVTQDLRLMDRLFYQFKNLKDNQ